MYTLSKPLVLRVCVGVAALLMVCALATASLAQSKTSKQPGHHVEIPADEKAEQDIQRIKDPDELVAAIVQFMAKYPDYPFLRGLSYSVTKLIKENHSDPAKVQALVEKFEKGTQPATSFARTEFCYEISRALEKNDVLVEAAAEIARKGLELSSEKDYIANENRIVEKKNDSRNQRNPERTPDVFSVDEAKEQYRAEHAVQIANLANIYRKLRRNEDAEKYYKQSYDVKPTMEAAVGLSEIYENRGDPKDALSYLSDAALTGRLPSEKLVHLSELYEQVYPGKSEKSLSSYLDDLYRERFRNPVTATEYVPDPKRSTRVVLAEMITGAGCEPCTAVDLAFDAALHRYDATDLALLVYHMHAPTSDPLANHSSQERIDFYAVEGAPSVYLDGKHVDVGEGLQTETPRVFDSLTHAVDARLTVAVGARVEVAAKLNGSKVNVRVSGKQVQSPDIAHHLQIALVEDEVSYSGENGFRFHPMVVRSVAQGTKDSSGFPLPKTATFVRNYAFDLDQVMAANLKYYDEYIAELKARTGISATFREKRDQIDPRRLSVVAFVQEDETKEILQSAKASVSTVDSNRSAE